MATTHLENGEEVRGNWNRVFRCLSAEPRRQLVVSLLDAAPDDAVPLPECAAMPNVPSDPDVLRRELHHVHLPMLAKHGFVTTETDPFVAARGPRFEELAVVLDALHSSAASIPDSLVVGCRRLEAEQQDHVDVS